MNSRPQVVASICLLLGAVLGIAGTFVSSAPLRGLAWGVDGIALVVASAVLAVHFFRLGQDLAAAGFLVFMTGETLVVSGSAVDPVAGGPVFAAGAGLWAAGLLLVSAARVYGIVIRILGVIAALLLGATALQILAGRALNPLSTPLPFFAYPFLAATLVGWAWHHGAARVHALR